MSHICASTSVQGTKKALNYYFFSGRHWIIVFPVVYSESSKNMHRRRIRICPTGRGKRPAGCHGPRTLLKAQKGRGHDLAAVPCSPSPSMFSTENGLHIYRDSINSFFTVGSYSANPQYKYLLALALVHLPADVVSYSDWNAFCLHKWF